MISNKEKEILAAKVLTDKGIALPLRLLSRKRRYIRWKMRVPTWESRIRMNEMYLKMNVRYDDLLKMTYEEKLQFMINHSLSVSRMVAYGIVRGPFLGMLLNRPVAWMLRNYMHPAALEESWMIINSIMTTVPFENIIRLAEATNLMAPNLSQPDKTKGS